MEILKPASLAENSLLAETKIDQPAAADMFAWLAAVVKDRFIDAAGVFQCICQDRQIGETVFVVDGKREFQHSSVIPGQARRLDGYVMEWIAEDVTYETRQDAVGGCIASGILCGEKAPVGIRCLTGHSGRPSFCPSASFPSPAACSPRDTQVFPDCVRGTVGGNQ